MLKQKPTAGFTLLEVLIVVMILSTIVSTALFFSYGEYRNTARRSESVIVATLLRSARSQAMSTVGGVAHGLAFLPDGYMRFAGASLAASDPASREFVPLSYHVWFATSSPREVVFAPLSGTTSEATIILIDAETDSSSSITITYEGHIE